MDGGVGQREWVDERRDRTWYQSVQGCAEQHGESTWQDQEWQANEQAQASEESRGAEEHCQRMRHGCFDDGL